MFARTSRLLLRPGWAEDVDMLHAAIADEGIVRNLASAPWPFSLADASAFLTRERDPLQPALLIFKRTLGVPRLVGGCGIGTQDDGKVELGYWIARRYWGLGFATEATAALMRLARAAGVRGVTASHFVDNPASGRVMRKLGFKPVGQPRERFSVGRGKADPCQYYEEGEVGEIRQDLSAELYSDTAPLAA